MKKKNYESVNFGLFSHNGSIFFEEAVKETNWCKAMDTKIDEIERNETWELIDLSPKMKIIGVQMVYIMEYNAEGKIDRHKT